MRNISNLFSIKFQKHRKKMSHFLAMGIVKSLLLIFLSWILIDILRLPAWSGSLGVVILGFFITYFLNVVTRLIKPGILKYFFGTLIFNILTFIFLWFFVDIVGLSGTVSTAIITVVFFFLRYIFFNMIGLIEHDERKT